MCVFYLKSTNVTHLLLVWLCLQFDLEHTADRYVVCLHDTGDWQEMQEKMSEGIWWTVEDWQVWEVVEKFMA